MCPLRVIVILLSLIVALIAVMVALAKDPSEEEDEPQQQQPLRRCWRVIADVCSGRYLYRQTKRFAPFLFTHDDNDGEGEEEAGSETTTQTDEDGDDEKKEDDRTDAGSLADPSDQQSKMADDEKEAVRDENQRHASCESGEWVAVDEADTTYEGNSSSSKADLIHRSTIPQQAMAAS